MTRGTLALIELALETGTLPKKFTWGQMHDPESGLDCFFGWCARQHGAVLTGKSFTHINEQDDVAYYTDTDEVYEFLDVKYDEDLPIKAVDQIIRQCGGDPRIAVPQIMGVLRRRVEVTNDR